MSNEPSKMWSGRFREPLDRTFEQWQRSFPFDVRRLPQEVEAAKAHARMIAAAGILTDVELEKTIDGLDAVGDISGDGIPDDPNLVSPRQLGAELGTTPGSIRRWLRKQPEFSSHHVKWARITLAIDDPLLPRLKTHFAVQENLNLDEYAGDGLLDRTYADLVASAPHAEDIHHFVELQLTKLIGDLALKQIGRASCRERV